MRILIVSDSHGIRDFSNLFKYFKPNYSIHCGDSQLSIDQMNAFDIKVRGNCDLYKDFNLEEEISIADINFYICHGDRYNVKYSLDSLIYKSQEVHANVVCYGHTHEVFIKEIDNCIYINPGSLVLPRTSFGETFVLLKIEEEQIVVELYAYDNFMLVSDFVFKRGK